MSLSTQKKKSMLIALPRMNSALRTSEVQRHTDQKENDEWKRKRKKKVN